MAFVNEYLSKEEKDMISKAELRDPRYIISKKYICPGKWTIDREKKMALIYCGELDREEHYKKVFTLICGELNNEHMISFTLVTNYYEHKEVESLRELHKVELVKKWKLIDYKIPNELLNKYSFDFFRKIILEALSVYRIDGNPQVQLSTKVFLEIEGDVE